MITCRAMVVLLTALWLLGGCERAMHDMYKQPKYGPGSPSTLFSDGNSARTPPPGTLTFSRDEASATPPVRTRALLERGRNRFNIYCGPCHGESGDGAGMVAERGFPAPPSYHTDKLRGVSDSHLYEVISDGYGVMYPYADRIEPGDRWAVVAYIRALQLSQYAPCDRLGTDDLRRLAEKPRQGAGMPATGCDAR
jgi:mono/diheme cytochrome c family protein